MATTIVLVLAVLALLAIVAGFLLSRTGRKFLTSTRHALGDAIQRMRNRKQKMEERLSTDQVLPTPKGSRYEFPTQNSFIESDPVSAPSEPAQPIEAMHPVVEQQPVADLETVFKQKESKSKHKKEKKSKSKLKSRLQGRQEEEEEGVEQNSFQDDSVDEPSPNDMSNSIQVE